MFLLERESVILSTVMETSEVFVIPHRTWRGGREPCVTWLGYVVQVKFELRLWRERENGTAGKYREGTSLKWESTPGKRAGSRWRSRQLVEEVG